MAKIPCFTLWWAGVMTLLHFTLFVCGSALPSSAGAPLRAAMVTLVQEADLPATLFSIKQIEDNFNNRHLYDWVFFSVQNLPEKFKEETSNATNATCIFEVIPNENWNVPGWTDQPQLPISHETNANHDSRIPRPTAIIRKMNRWRSAPFAKEKRLKTYEWFWRVEPGVQLHQKIPFDVFRLMRDNGIAYGFNREILGQADLCHLSPRIKSFVDKHPELLHKEADVSWLIQIDAGLTKQSSSLDDGFQDLVDESSDELRSRDDSTYDSEAKDEGNETSWLGGCFASWLNDAYGNSLYPTFELGSLAFFRSSHHVAFFDHLDSAGDFQYRRVDDVPVHSLSASMFLPRESVWNFRTKEVQLCEQNRRGPSRPGPSPGGGQSINDCDSTDSGDSVDREDGLKAARPLYDTWDDLAVDFKRQTGVPHLISGNTWMGAKDEYEDTGHGFMWLLATLLSRYLG
ncbi:mannosyltransferase [Fusarium heterosporum]|uniref:Mannosyltransferase n=1 Tax=Fusarium heterosporum TaxID=42747 RepID=A0A8H5TI64_FUSHE|nr:mannosyltransferase [Fusarium heterosporum]